MKFLKKISGTVTDITTETKNYYSGSSIIDLTTTDYIYIGSYFPFNHIYLDFSTVSVDPSVLSVSIWDGQSWTIAAEVMDQTSLLGATMGQSGFVSWVPRKNSSWGREDTVDSSSTELVTGLGSVTIYDQYWVRLSVDSDLTPTTDLKWAGHLFSNDLELGTEFPDLVLSNTLGSFKSGKTDWQEQHIRASEIIVNDLISKNVIFDKGQILDRSSLMPASVQKTAALAFAGFGKAHAEDKKSAEDEYSCRLDKCIKSIDQNKNARVDAVETVSQFGSIKLTRGPIHNNGGFW